MEVGGQRHALAALLPGERDRVPIVQEAGCAPGTGILAPPPAFYPQTAQPLASRSTDSAIPAHA